MKITFSPCETTCVNRGSCLTLKELRNLAQGIDEMRTEHAYISGINIEVRKTSRWICGYIGVGDRA